MGEPQVCMACGADPIKGRPVQLNPRDPRYALCRACGSRDIEASGDNGGRRPS